MKKMPSGASPRAGVRGGCAFGLVLVACGGGAADLDASAITGSPDAPAPIACASPDLVNASVTVENQSQLEALRGCSAVNGNLAVLPFDGVDLRPLWALERVQGVFMLGDPNTETAALGFDSLEGLAALRQVGGLSLWGLSVASLEGLAGLREVTRGSDRLTTYGMLVISQSPELTDLRGLENLTGMDTLTLIDNPRLSSLAGLSIGAEFGQLRISNSPVRDIDALKPLRRIAYLTLENTAVTDVSALTGLSRVDQELNLEGNSALVDMTGLVALSAVQSLRIANNPRLEVLGTLPQLTKLRSLLVVNNESLREALEWPALPTDIDGGMFVANARLTSVQTFSSLRYAKGIVIECNPELSELNLGRLEGMATLRLANNPQLDAERVPRFANTAAEIGGNLGDPLPLGACP